MTNAPMAKSADTQDQIRTLYRSPHLLTPSSKVHEPLPRRRVVLIRFFLVLELAYEDLPKDPPLRRVIVVRRNLVDLRAEIEPPCRSEARESRRKDRVGIYELVKLGFRDAHETGDLGIRASYLDSPEDFRSGGFVGCLDRFEPVIQ